LSFAIPYLDLNAKGQRDIRFFFNLEQLWHDVAQVLNFGRLQFCSNLKNSRACPSARTYFKQESQRKSTHFEVWNFDGEGKNQASGCFEDLIPTSKAKTVKGDSKNTTTEGGILNGSPAGF